MSAEPPPVHIFSFLSHSQRKKRTSSPTSLDQIQKPFSSHLDYADLLTLDLEETEGKGDMSPATEFDLFSGLGGRGEGALRRAEGGQLRKTVSSGKTSWLPSPAGLGLLVCADLRHSIYDTPQNNVPRGASRQGPWA